MSSQKHMIFTRTAPLRVAESLSNSPCTIAKSPITVHPDDARGRQKIGTGQRRCNDRRSATPYPYRCPRWAATPCPRRRPRLPAPAPPSPCSWTTAPRRRRESAKGPRRSRCRRRNTPGRILRAALGGDPTRGPRDDHGCGFLMRRATPLAMDQCQRAPTPAASFSAAPCPRRLCPWGPPRHTPTGAPGGLPHHALAGALVFRRPRRRRTRPPRGQQPHAQGPGRSRCRHRNSFGLAHCAPSSSGARAADELALLVDNSPTPTAQAR